MWMLRFGIMLALMGCAEPHVVTEQSEPDMLQIGLAAEPGTLDPHQGAYVVENTVTGDLFEGLFEVQPNGQKTLAAAATWEVSEDGKRWTFSLHKDLKWSDGKPIDAYDFRYALRRFVNPATASRSAFVLNPIVNAQAIIAGELPAGSLAVVVPEHDPYQLIIDLIHPAPDLVTTLIVNRAGIPLPKHNIEAHPDTWTQPRHWISNGAYTLSEWRPQEYLELVQNPNYRKTVAIPKFRYIPTASMQSEYNRFRSGELHITSTVPTASLKQAASQQGSALHTANSLRVQYLVFNVTQPPFNNVELRQALAMVLDPHAITEKILPEGFAPTTSIVPPTVSNYTPAEPPHLNMTQVERQSEAKRLLHKNGYNKDNPLRLTLRFIAAGLERKKATIAIMGLWREIGVITQLQQSEMKVHYADVSARNFDVAYAAWSGTDSPQSFLLEYSVEDPSSNLSGYRSSKYLETWQQALEESDIPQRYNLFKQAEHIVLSEYIVAPLFNPQTHRLVSPEVSGWQDEPLSSHAVRFLSWRAR